jgi:hypothetical protein
MKLGDLVRHRTFGYYGVVIGLDLEIDRRFRYVEIHWIQGNLSPIWFLDHDLLEVLDESR